MKKALHLSTVLLVCIVLFVPIPTNAQETTPLPKVKKVRVLKKTPKTITVKWKKVKRAKSYHVRVHTRENGKWTKIRVITKVKKNKKKIKKLTPGKKYRFRVRAIRKTTRGKWSKKLERKTKPAVESPDDDNSDNDGDNSDDGNNNDEQNCVSNTTPVFTEDITDLNQVSQIIEPPSLVGGTDLKTHSYLFTDLNRVPVYAPVDMVLDNGSFYQEGNDGGEYLLEFEVSCEIRIRFDHVTEPIDDIRNEFSDTPADTSQTNQVENRVEFAAGDIVGYTTGTIYGVWDFGVYNSEVENQFADDPEWDDSPVYTTAICPYDFYAGTQRSTFYDLFTRPKPDNFVFEGTDSHCILE